MRLNINSFLSHMSCYLVGVILALFYTALYYTLYRVMPNEIRQDKYDIKQPAPLNNKTPPPKSLEAYGLLYLIYIFVPTPFSRAGS